ncbi:MAG: HEAT repeat domain-containing protein [Actinomycetota bacterium]
MPLFGPPNIDKLKEKQDVEGLVKALHDRSENVRLRAAAALSELGELAIDAVVPEIQSSNRAVREAAVYALSGARSQRAIDPLSQALGDPDSLVRREAARGLMRLADPSASEQLAGALDDGDEVVRRVAAFGLAELGDGRAVEPLITELQKTQIPGARDEAAKLLGNLGDARAVGPLAEVVASATEIPVEHPVTGERRDVRDTAAAALREIGGTEAEQALAAYGSRLPSEPEPSTTPANEPAPPAASEIPAHWGPGPAGSCDICNDSIQPSASHRVPSSEFQGFVRRGYNPLARGRANTGLAAALGMGVSEAYDGWKMMALQDSSDWGLCILCAQDVAAFSTGG